MAPTVGTVEPTRQILFKPPEGITETQVEALWREPKALEQFLRDYGPAVTVQQLADSEKRRGTDCHSLAHTVGRRSYELFGEQVIALVSHECHAGALHGATEAYFLDRGADQLQQDMSALCSDSLNSFLRHQCVHGIGHGLTAWYKYDLPKVLDACDTLSLETDRGSCQSGVFMENIVGGLSGAMGLPTKYLSNDPHYPCNGLGPHYQEGCYFYQTSRMLQLAQGDFQKVAQWCGEAPRSVQFLCYASMGRDVGGATRGNPGEAIRLCAYIADAQYRRACLTGAVQDSFWDTGGAEEAIRFCRLLGDPDDKAA
ncbi:MAG: hypothetical protein EXR53_02740, partial [Dehalococcoidia bacterium]|nr:hypothetical protein [Dehalococcoidia bacterium]